eukprot:TRINITY_DN24443_c0_g2_i1.p1 TRINITY_DN24443_c0_g2~~TRINITY_DN24443_c0_g2_i1.p1  ORF type:complete len:564 (-),score=165.73 TRINITY_DN24443_c0_g2_i1:118-1809(-)
MKCYKMYAASVNKLAYKLLGADTTKDSGVMQLMASLDHVLFKWIAELSLAGTKSRNALESYYKQFLLGLINKALYLKRQNLLPSAIAELTNAIELCREAKYSRRSETVHVCGRFFLCLGVLYLEVRVIDEAQSYLLEGIKCLIQEHKLLTAPLSFIRECLLTSRQSRKMRRNLVVLGAAVYNVGLAYEMVRESKEALESYRMCSWCYNVERSIFKKRPVLEPYKFMIESSGEKESEISVNLKVDQELSSVAKTNMQLKVIEEVKAENYIDSLWNTTNNTKETDQQIRKRNFALILNSAQGSSKPGKPKQSITNTTSLPHSTILPKPKHKPNSFFITGISQPATRYPQAKSKKPWQELISPDEYFEELVCSTMRIDRDWISESSRKKRYGQDKVKEMMNNERAAQRSINILKSYLTTKSKDKTIKEPQDDHRNFAEMFASNVVKHKVYTLNKNLANIISESQQSLRKYDKVFPKLRTQPTCTLASKEDLDEDEEQKLTEELQREIERIEREMQSSGAWKSGKEEIEVFSNVKTNGLANSVVKHKENAVVKRPSKRIITKSLFHK